MHPGVERRQPARDAKDFVEEMAQRYGKDSNAYRVRVLGEFPTPDDNTLIPAGWWTPRWCAMWRLT